MSAAPMGLVMSEPIVTENGLHDDYVPILLELPEYLRTSVTGDGLHATPALNGVTGGQVRASQTTAAKAQIVLNVSGHTVELTGAEAERLDEQLVLLALYRVSIRDTLGG